MEIEPALPLRRIVEGFAQRLEIGEAPGKGVNRRRRCHHALRTRHIGVTQFKSCHPGGPLSSLKR